MMTENIFRDRLRFLRNEKGVSAREMSLALGQNESYINKIETGKTSTTISSFLNICEYLNISPSDFFDERVNNVVDIQELIKYFKLLNSKQTKYMIEFLKDLTTNVEQ